MRRDREGFDYPVANPDLCLGCGRCKSVCPVLDPLPVRTPLEAYAAKANGLVEGSSSGGVFPALARKVIDKGGVVFGAVLNPDMTVGHTEADTIEELERMRGSKYVQSDLYSVYEDARAYLDEGREVMFSGTPCQVSGLMKYLNRPYDNLLAVDFACHGVPSPGLWELYVKALEKKHGGRMTHVCFKDKSQSWRHYSFATNFGRKEYIDDPYMALFVQDMTLRPSCHACPSSEGKSGSDITLSDLWSVDKVAPAMNDDRGVSGVYINTEKGRDSFIGCEADCMPVDIFESRKNNGGFERVCNVPEKRDEFFKGMHSAKDLIGYMSSYVVRRPLHKRMYRWLRSRISAMKRKLLK